MIDEYCPIRNDGNCRCMGKSCAWWDGEREQCCIKSAALAVAGNKGGSTPLPQATYEQARYIPPTAMPNPNINSPYTIICQDDEPFEPCYIPY